MKFFLYAQAYSYGIEELPDATDRTSFSLLSVFATLLDGLGEVLELNDPLQAEKIHRLCAAQGEDSILLSFAPPHLTPLLPTCPVVPVFAWEYPNIPERAEETAWHSDPRHDWRFALSGTRGAIVLTRHASEAIKRSMGPDYPVAVIPLPVSDVVGQLTHRHRPGNLGSAILEMRGSVADSLQMNLNVDTIVAISDEDAAPFEITDLTDLPPVGCTAGYPSMANLTHTSHAHASEPGFNDPVPCGWEPPAVFDIRTRLRGVVYTAALAPSKDQDNWEDLLTAFCWNFRDSEEATLLLIINDPAPDICELKLVMLLSKLSPLKCRVLAIYGLPDADGYQSIIEASSYFVSSALASAGCQQLIDFMAAGIPVIAPTHTGFADLIDEDTAFVVRSIPGIPRVWPHGDHDIYRTSWHQLDWQSLVDAFRQSHAVATHKPARYAAMAENARQRLLTHNNVDATKAKLFRFLSNGQARAPKHRTQRNERKTATSNNG